MVQPRCSKLPLASVAGYLRGDDPAAVWAAEAGPLRVLAEACDGDVPNRLVAELAAALAGPDWAGPAAALAAWLEAAERCVAPGLGGEADAWVDQVRAEARLGRRALTVIEAARPGIDADADGAATVTGPDPDTVAATAFAVAAGWPTARRSAVSVMGVRAGFRPVAGQRSDGRWTLRREALQHDTNAIDALVRLAFDAAAAVSDDDQLVVTVDGSAVDVVAGRPFPVTSGVTVEVRAGSATTGFVVP